MKAVERSAFESFQNWQSEFLSIAVVVVLSIFLRQKGSPESKPVQASHAENKKCEKPSSSSLTDSNCLKRGRLDDTIRWGRKPVTVNQYARAVAQKSMVPLSFGELSLPATLELMRRVISAEDDPLRGESTPTQTLGRTENAIQGDEGLVARSYSAQSHPTGFKSCFENSSELQKLSSVRGFRR